MEIRFENRDKFNVHGYSVETALNTNDNDVGNGIFNRRLFSDSVAGILIKFKLSWGEGTGGLNERGNSMFALIYVLDCSRL